MPSFKNLLAIGTIAIAGQSFAGDKTPYPDTQVEGVSATSRCVLPAIPESILNLQYLTSERARVLCEQALVLGEENIWQILSDYNRDNIISDDDVGLVPGNQLSHLLTDIEVLFQNQNREKELYQNFAWILAQGGYPVGNISTKTEFIQKIKEHHRGIPAFQNGVETVIQGGIPLEYALYYGKDAQKKWKEARNTICSDEDFGQIYCMIQGDISQFPSHLDALRKEGKITEEEYQIKKANLEEIIRDGSLEQDIFKEIFSLLPTLGGMFVTGNYPLFYRTGNSMVLDKNMLQSRLGLGFGVNNGDNNLDKGGFMQGGLNIRLGMNDNGELQIFAGVFRGATLTIPSLQLTYRKMGGFQQVKESPIPDTSTILTSTDFGGGFDFFGPYLKIQKNNHRVETISTKVSYFDTLLSKVLVFQSNASIREYMEYLSEKFQTTPQLSYLVPMLPNISTKLESMGYPGESQESTKEILEILRKSIISEFYTYALYSGFTETHIAGTGVKIGAISHPTLSVVWTKKETNPVLSDEVRSEALSRNALIPTLKNTLSNTELVSWFSSLSPDISVSEKDGIISIHSYKEGEDLLAVFEKSSIRLKYIPGSVTYNFDGKILSFGNIEDITYRHLYRTMGKGSEITLGAGKPKKSLPLEIKKPLTQLTPLDKVVLHQGLSIISGTPNLIKKEVGL